MNRKFKVKSRTDKNTSYFVYETQAGLECSCQSGMRGRNCNHKDIIKLFINRQSQPLEDMERIEEIK